MTFDTEDHAIPPPRYTKGVNTTGATSAPPQTSNVLIVGESQQGKSSLIKFLADYAGIKDLDIGIGNGNLACTKVTRGYEISTTLQKYCLADLDGSTISRRSYSEMCDLGPEDAQVLPVEEGASDEKTNFLFVDSPGLDDSEGQDLEIMADIIGKVGQLDHINAVIYIRSTNKPFGHSFHQFFNYIQRSMPCFSNGLIIVHSHFSIEHVEQYATRNQDLAAIRREAVTSLTSLELPHFFMDNEPSDFSPFAQLQSLNEIHRFLSYLKCQSPLPVHGLKLLKTANMEQVEIYVIQAVTERRNQLEKDWNTEKSHAQTLEQNVIAANRSIARIENRILEAKVRIEELENGSDIILGTKTVVKDYSFLTNLLVKQEVNLGRKDVAYDSDCRIAYVRKTLEGGSKWLSEDLRGTSWRATITAGWFRSISGSATFYAKAAEKHKAEVRACNERVQDLEEQLREHQESLARNGGGASKSSKADKLGTVIEACNSLLGLLNQGTFDIKLYPELKRFYAQKSRPSRDDIREFVQVFDPNLGSYF